MKKLFLIILTFIPLVSFSQTENETKEIVALIVNQYKMDTINIFYKFHNNDLINDFQQIKSDNEIATLRKYYKIVDSIGYDKYFDRIQAEIFDDSITIQFENVLIPYFINEKRLKQTESKKIKKLYDEKYVKNKKTRPISSISIPLISKDQKKALIYVSHIFGSLEGHGDIVFFEKINGKWKISGYKMRWIS